MSKLTATVTNLPLSDSVNPPYVLLFSGGNIDTNSNSETNTFKWDGANWTQLFPDTIPTSPYGNSWKGRMAYDTFRQKWVMVNPWGQTWEFDGTDWAIVGSYPYGPGVLSFDKNIKKTIITGNTIVATWDGSVWETVYNMNMNAGTYGPAVCFSDVNNYLLMYSPNTQETFYYDAINNSVTQLYPVTIPTINSPISMLTFNYNTNRAILYGWAASDSRYGFWEWDGTDWIFGALTPGQPSETAICYDPGTGGVILFGGSGSNMDETWLYQNSSVSILNPQTSPGRTIENMMA